MALVLVVEIRKGRDQFEQQQIWYAIHCLKTLSRLTYESGGCQTWFDYILVRKSDRKVVKDKDQVKNVFLSIDC